MAVPCSRTVFLGKQVFMKNWLGACNIAPAVIQVATLRPTFGEKFPYPEPFPYKEKKFTLFHDLFDQHRARLNENTKIITVEGNVAVGKKDFAKRLAKEFDLHYIPPVEEKDAFQWNKTVDFDIRDLDDILPPDCQAYDFKKLFHDDHPECGRIGKMLCQWYYDRVKNYADASLHALSTGQGCVLVRSIFSDEVMLTALRRMGWITPKFFHYFKTIIIDNCVCDFLKPHLSIYLDASPQVCLQRVKQRKDPREGKNLNLDFLQTVEDVYKNQWIEKQRIYYEVMELDWNEVGDDIDMDVIAEEISRLTLENTDMESPKFKDWRMLDDDRMSVMKKMCQDKHTISLYSLGRPGPFECPEVFGTTEQRIEWVKAYKNHPALKYIGGNAPEFGHDSMWRFS